MSVLPASRATNRQTTPDPPAAIPADSSSVASERGQLWLWMTLAALPLSVLVLWKADLIRPGSLSRAGPRVLPPVLWTLWVAGAALVFLAVPLGASLALAVSGTEIPAKGRALDPDAARAHGISVIGGYGIGVVVAIVLLHIMRRRLEIGRELCWLGFASRDALNGVVAMALAFPIVQAVNIASVFLYEAFSRQRVAEMAHTTLEAMKNSPEDPWVWVQVGAAVVGAPVVEEVLYRVMLQTAVLKLTGRAWVAVLVSSLIFGLSHVGAVEWYAMPTLMMLGAALGVAYERTKSVGVPIVMHVVFNAVNVGLALMV